jgi:L-seryl-tRNA(Ser) seleniumtransferase
VADLTGTWRVEIAYAASRSTHTLHLRQRGGEVDGTHQGEFVSRGLTGEIAGREVTLRSHYGEEHGDALSFRFTGTVDGDTMTGTLDMGEYLHAAWRATRG